MNTDDTPPPQTRLSRRDRWLIGGIAAGAVGAGVLATCAGNEMRHIRNEMRSHESKASTLELSGVSVTLLSSRNNITKDHEYMISFNAGKLPVSHIDFKDPTEATIYYQNGSKDIFILPDRENLPDKSLISYYFSLPFQPSAPGQRPLQVIFRNDNRCLSALHFTGPDNSITPPNVELTLVSPQGLDAPAGPHLPALTIGNAYTNLTIRGLSSSQADRTLDPQKQVPGLYDTIRIQSDTQLRIDHVQGSRTKTIIERTGADDTKTLQPLNIEPTFTAKEDARTAAPPTPGR